LFPDVSDSLIFFRNQLGIAYNGKVNLTKIINVSGVTIPGNGELLMTYFYENNTVQIEHRTLQNSITVFSFKKKAE